MPVSFRFSPIFCYLFRYQFGYPFSHPFGHPFGYPFPKISRYRIKKAGFSGPLHAVFPAIYTFLVSPCFFRSIAFYRAMSCIPPYQFNIIN
jgi:hypothetical protein